MHAPITLSSWRSPPADDPKTVVFESTFLGTQLECTYGANAAAFRSDNVTTMSILKEVLTKEATMAKVALNTTFSASLPCFRQTPHLLEPCSRL
jgi:Bardet-Biedl syndrome 7 protein